MDERKSWRRGFAAGFLTLALAVGGQFATRPVANVCPVEARPSIAEQIIAHLKPAVRDHGGVAQRVALAVIGAVEHSTCS